MREDVLNKCVPDHFLTRGEDEGGLYLRNNARFRHIKQDSLNFKKSQCNSHDLNVWQPHYLEAMRRNGTQATNFKSVNIFKI